MGLFIQNLTRIQLQQNGTPSGSSGILNFVGRTVEVINNGLFGPADIIISSSVRVYQNGTLASTRENLNFIGATVADDAFNARTDITITGGGGSGFSGSTMLITGSVFDPGTTLGSFALIPEMTGAIVTNGGDLLISFNGSWDSRVGDNARFALLLDGVHISSSERRVGQSLGMALSQETTHLAKGVSAGVHQVAARWTAGTGTARMTGSFRVLTAFEII